MNALTSTLTLATLLTLTFGQDMPEAVATNCSYVTVGGTVVSANCSSRGWTRVPVNLPPSLRSLDLSRNSLVTLPGRPFYRYPLLETLDLSDNQIVGLDNSSFSGLFRLKWLSLRMNKLRMKREVFPGDAFRDLTGLLFLDLHLNQPEEWNPDLVYPDAALASASTLRTLKMDGLATNIDLGPGFSKLHHLEVLDINDITGNCLMTALSEKFFFHINTSRPLTVNLTDCKLRVIHNNTFFFLPTLHTLDLGSNRHLNFPPFMQASQSLRWTRIKVLDISGIHRGNNIRITADDFKYLGYTWLERFTCSGVNAFDIDLRAIFNLPTSLTYLSFYDNKLINATFLFGLYLLPHIDTIQGSRQNHFSSESMSDDLNHPQNMTGAASETDKYTKKIQGYDKNAQYNDTKLLFVSNNSRTMQRHPSLNLHATNRYSPVRPEKMHADNVETQARNTNSTVSQMADLSENAVLRPTSRNLHQGKLKQFQSGYDKEPPHDVESDPRGLKATSSGGTRQPLFDPSVCFNPTFRKAQESHLRAFLTNLKSFLLKHNIQFNQTTRPQPLPVRNRTSLKDGRVSVQGYNATTKTDYSIKSWATAGADLQDDHWPLPPTIRRIYASELKLGYVLPPIHFFDNHVETFDISRNNLPCFVGPFLGLRRLRSFDLSNNFAVYLSQEFFEDMPSLTHLYLQGNFLGDSLANDSSGRILRGLKSLEVLNLNDNSIKHLSPHMFLAQENVTRLSLARNALRRFAPRIGHLTALTFLDLSENSMEYLERDVLDDLDTIRGLSNLTVDLDKNPLSCDCESLEFWRWMTQPEVAAHFRRVEEYTCTLGNGSVIGYETVKRELDSLMLQCQGAKFLAVAVGMLVALLFLLSLLGIVHYKRWQLRYFYYVGLRRLRHPYDHHHLRNHQVNNDIKDVFISFDDDSGDFRVIRFVHEVLQPELQRRGLTYYTSEGQFADRPIRDIIPEAILGARKTLAILSAHFFPSYERELEFNMAVYHEEIIHRQVIVAGLVGPVDWSTFPPEVLVYLGEHPCAIYRENEDEAFARTLAERIRADVRL